MACHGSLSLTSGDKVLIGDVPVLRVATVLSTRQSLWMLAAGLGFACMGVCVKFAAAYYGVAEIVFWRSLVALLAMVALLRLRGIAFSSGQWRLQMIRGVVGFVSLLLFFTAIARLPLATAVTLNYTSPIFLCAFLAVAGGLRLRLPAVAVLILGFVGVGLLLKPSFSAEQGIAALIGLGSGIGAGLAYYCVRLLGQRGEHEARTVFYFSLVASCCAGVWMLFADFSPFDPRGSLWLFGVAVFATAAQLAMTRSYRRGKAMVSASLSYSAVVFSSLFGVLLWQETLDFGSLLAIALIIASGVASTRVAKANPAEQD